MTKNIFTIAIIAIIFVFTSCEKDEVTINQPQANETKDILTFATQEDFDKTLAKVNSMTKEERLAWEKEQGFKSFGTICDEFYATIDPQSFKSTDEIKAFVARNSDKIEFYTSSDGETYCVTKDFKTVEKYLLNENHVCKIENKIVSFSNNSMIEIPLLFKTKAAITEITEVEAYGNNTIGSDTYRIHAWMDTYLYMNEHRVAIKVSNFSRSLGIWWLKDAWAKINATFTTSDSQNHVNSGAFNNWEYYDTYEWLAGFTAPIYTTTPFFTKFNCHTENKFTKKDGRYCICVANMVLN
jgi:hypothetical protein